MILFILFIVVVAALVIDAWGTGTLGRVIAKRNSIDSHEKKESISLPNLSLDTSKLEEQIKALPNQILSSITNATNTHKGKLGELIGYVSIRGEYDRLIPLGNIVDFVGIIFPVEGREGRVDFIDVKTGQDARLTKEQNQLKKLLINKQVGFRTIKIQDIEGFNAGEENNPKAD